MRFVLALGLSVGLLSAFGCEAGDKASEAVKETGTGTAAKGAAGAEGKPVLQAAGRMNIKDVVPAVLAGRPAPDVKLTDASGKAHDLAAYKGKVVVLEWTEQGCPYVKRHYAAGTMQKLAKKYEGKVVWLAVNSSHFVKPDETLAWKKDNGITYPVLLDPTGEVGKAYGAKTTPHMFVIDAEGKVAYEGAIDSDSRGEAEDPVNYVDQAVSALLEGLPVAVPSTRSYGCSVKYGA